MEVPVFVPPRHSRRPLLIGVIALAVMAIVAAGLLVARNGLANNKKSKKDDGPTAAPVELTTVGKGAISTFLETTTVLEAANTAILVARRQGQVVALLVEEGQDVRTGQPLARLDDSEARITLGRAQAAFDQAQRDADRGAALETRGLSSAATMDDLKLKLANAKQGLAQARYDLAQTRIVAPFSGKVVTRMIQLGETVTPGKECFRLDDFTPLLARVYFPERDQAQVHVGQSATIEVTALPGTTYPARVTLINPVVDHTNGTFKITLEVVDPKGTLRPGSFARVRLTSGSFADATVLPKKAVVTEDGDSFVFLAAGDSVNRTPVTVGAISGDTAQILAGLTPGQRVVSVGQGGLKQGSRIKAVAF
ncbi:MAG: efflux RND transporter periplasmic adaptor subunit [Candidatus Eisenbacteria bacterium]